MKIMFDCPKCHCFHVEEVIEVQETSLVQAIMPYGVYLEQAKRYYGHKHFRCACCGYPLIDDNGPVSNPSRLIR